MQPKEGTRFVCPSCGKFLGVSDGRYFEPPPCSCGWQVVLRNVKAVSR